VPTKTLPPALQLKKEPLAFERDLILLNILLLKLIFEKLTMKIILIVVKLKSPKMCTIYKFYFL